MFLIESIYFRKDKFILDIPYLKIPQTGLTLISGPSGSGKSLFLKTLMGFEKSERNFKWLYQENSDEKDLARLTPPDRRLGVVFQTLELFPHLTVKENILFHARARGLNLKIAEERLVELSHIAKIETRLESKIKTLSGGEKQRVAILRAVIGNPNILLMDEPFSSLDESIKNNLRVFLKDLLKKEKIPCILVSHDLRDKEIADKIIYINAGKITNSES